ncbi:TonB-dependent receptor [Cellulophaga sp. 20_2_10]|uniref:SusC/RagA family TonB-linked outer membrane protein n=1 Tax=Cellulophaga sp. 20_2_10 TaxID=2942476 RepID=UPI00201AF786|nr:TonB-dependent receptor [Cellulophaga sp. 20_2_10]MCL5246289.1 TonB-dependent receptor [Cellulophaga sp. 20_2_10]
MKLNLQKCNYRKMLLTALLLLSFGFIQAQNVTIKGTVSADGDSLLGASVIVKGSSNGQSTEMDGTYELKAKLGDILVFSYLGYKTKEVTIITGKTTINVELLGDASLLDEIVIVGYGTQKKKEVTGAVVNVGAEEISRSPVADLGAAIQGKVAGVNIQASSGRPGEAANVQIRGLGSVSSGAAGPLYVVDGIPYEGNPNISPDQIESLDILKDGAAASIYGTRASNGVILITTKKGKAGKMKIDLSTYTGIQSITSGTPLMNTAQQLYSLEIATEQLGSQPQTFFINANALDFDTNFVKDVQNDNAIIQNVSLNISGGVENLTLNFNTNYFKQDGVLINSGFNRLANRLTGQFTKGKFKAFATLGYTIENRTQEPYALYEYSIGQSPWSRPLSDIPSIGENSVTLDVENEIFYGYLSRQLENIDERETKSSNIALNLEYEIAKGLKYKLNLGSNEYNYFRKFFRPQYLAYARDGTLNATASTEQALLNEDYIFSKRESIENILNYSTNFGKHNLNLLGVISYERFKQRNLGVGVIYSKDASNSLQTLGSGAEGIKPTSNNQTSTLAGKLVRAQYNYDEKYLLSASYRRDASSKFSENNRYGNFFGFSAGWNVSEENWFNVDAISNLKLRGSWAEVGNQGIAPYQFTAIIESGINYPFGPNEELNFGSIQRRYVDPNIKWETTISKNIGVDLSMFSNKLNITADVYQNDKKDMLLQERLPASSGTYHTGASGVYDVKQINAGDMVNKGLELSLSYKDRIGDDLKYSISGTFTKNINEVTDLNGIDRGYANGRPTTSLGENIDYTTFLAKGYEAGSFFLLQNDGVIKTQEQLDAYNLLDVSATGTPQLGDMMYKDTNNDGAVNDNDRVYSGSGQAEFEAGLGLNLDYKGFDFFVQTFYSHGAEVYNGSKLYAYTQGRHTDLYNMWSPQNPTSDVPTFRRSAFHNNVRAASNYFLEDGTYLRIRTLTLGYTIPGIEDTGIDKARVYLTSTNPFTFTNYSGYDPEVGGDGIFTRGVDRGNYPVTRQFMLGVQLSF